jgi:mRNA interferase RelE/StbE
MYSVVLSDTAKHYFEPAEASLQRKLDRCFIQLATEPRRHNNIKPLKGKFSRYLRFHVGDYRVIYRINDFAKSVIVVEIVKRADAYE